jgi:hypothetical protein
MPATKAFLSTKAAGELPQAYVDAYAAAYLMGPQGDKLDALASYEASRILAENQSDGKPTCDHPSRRLPAMVARANGRALPARKVRHWTLRQDVAWEASQALAESLAAVLPVLDEYEAMVRR